MNNSAGRLPKADEQQIPEKQVEVAEKRLSLQHN
jgi:hypothetical protein